MNINFIKNMFKNLDDDEGLSDEDIKNELTDAGIDIEKAKKSFFELINKYKRSRHKQRRKTMTETKLDITLPTRHYADIIDEQTNYININFRPDNGRVWVSECDPPNTTSMDVAHGMCYEIPVNAVLTCEALCDLIKEISPTLERIMDEYTDEWVNGNWHGYLTEKGDHLFKRVCVKAREYHDDDEKCCELHDAAEWYMGYGNWEEKYQKFLRSETPVQYFLNSFDAEMDLLDKNGDIINDIGNPVVLDDLDSFESKLNAERDYNRID